MMNPGFLGECVWSPDKDQNGEMVELKGPEYERKVVKILCEDFCKVLAIEWKDHRIVSSILEFALNDKIRTLLDQYLNSQLEIIARGFKYDFNLTEVKIDHEYAVHARFDSLKEELRKILKEELEKKKEE